MLKPSTLLSVGLVTLSLACGSDDDTDLPSLLTRTVTASDTDCPHGGSQVLTGRDENDDGELQAEEVDDSELVCSGAPGDPGAAGADGANALVRTALEPAGANCAEGGVRIEAGLDADADGVLDGAEITTTSFACNQARGPAGRNYLVDAIDEAPGCELGGVTLRGGYDDNDNALLDDLEVRLTEELCASSDGSAALVNIDAEPAGANCTAGGQRFTKGLDTDESGTLEPTEIDVVSFVCNPVSNLVRATELAPGGDCALGGSQVERGLDNNGNGNLDASEVQETVLLCAGADGIGSLVDITDEPAGSNCALGGLRVQTGRDDDGDGVLSSAEVDITSYACDGANGADGRGNNAIRLFDEAPGAVCANGGTRIETGPDTNANGVLDDAEVTSTTFACSAAAQTSLVSITEEPSGTNCLNGGQRVDSGFDLNFDGVLSSLEITQTAFVCSSVPTVPIGFSTPSDLGSTLATVDLDVAIEAVGGLGGGFRWQLVPPSELPPGVSLSPTGTPATVLSGAATATGTFTFEIQVTDFIGSTARQSFTLVVDPVPCQPGVGGIAGTDETIIASVADFLSTQYNMAVDTAVGGWVYAMSTTTLIRASKDGLQSENVLPLAGLVSADFGYEIEFDGPNLYVVSDATTGSTDRVFRISTDGGTTFGRTSMVDFGTVVPTDIRGFHVDGTTMYLMTQTTATTIYEADISGTLPATATQLLSTSAISECSGLTMDDFYFYTACSTRDEVVRIDRTTFAIDVLAAGTATLDVSSTSNELVIQDPDGDGRADILWIQGFDERLYICEPSLSAPYFLQNWATTLDSTYGMDLDPVNNAIWMYDDSPNELFRLD